MRERDDGSEDSDTGEAGLGGEEVVERDERGSISHALIVFRQIQM